LFNFNDVFNENTYFLFEISVKLCNDEHSDWTSSESCLFDISYNLQFSYEEIFYGQT